jgi:hypothetical protein
MQGPLAVYVLEVRRAVLTPTNIECNRDTTAALVMYGVQMLGRYLYELQDVWYWL